MQPFWTSSVTNKRKARGSVIPHEHLKLVKIKGFYCRTSDFELAAFIIRTCVALKKIVIDPCHNQRQLPLNTVRKFLMNKEAALSSAKRQLETILPSGVELCIL